MDRITYKSAMGDYGSKVEFESTEQEIACLRNALGKYEDIGLTADEIIQSINKLIPICSCCG